MANIGVCFPNFAGEFSFQTISDPICIKNDYNMIIKPTTFDFTCTKEVHSFKLNVLVDGKNDEIPCEFYTKLLNNEKYYPIYYFSKSGNSNISFFETSIILDDIITAFIGFDYSTKIKLNTCSVTEKIIYFFNIKYGCLTADPNQYFLDVILYGKMNGFQSKYSFNLYLDSPSGFYMNCTIPQSQSNLQELTILNASLIL